MYSTQKVLELACSAYRMYNGYIKERQVKYDDNGIFLFCKYSNKELIKFSLDIYKAPTKACVLTVSQQDVEEANSIQKFFKRLIFSAIEGQNIFESEVYTLLKSETIPFNKIGFIACLPHSYRLAQERNNIKKLLRECENDKLLGDHGKILDKNCNILKITKSKNFNAWNILGIVDNKIVSWMSNKEHSVGPVIIQKANIKNYNTNYITGNTETRLNYVKLFQ